MLGRNTIDSTAASGSSRNGMITVRTQSNRITAMDFSKHFAQSQDVATRGAIPFQRRLEIAHERMAQRVRAVLAQEPSGQLVVSIEQ
jgi:hypothetical protein